MIEIMWCNHSYVVLRLIEKGLTIAIDPHDGLSVGLPTCSLNADLVLITHNHYDHNAISVAKGPNSIVLESAKGERTFHDVKIVGREFYHDKNRGKLRGLVAAYCLEIEKIRICHLGDIGHVPQEDQLHEFKEVDLLMLPIGGVYTIDGGEAWHLVRILEPKMVMPLHYWLPGSMLPLDPLDSFLNIAKAQRLRMSSNKFELPFKEGLEKTALIIPQPLKRRLDDGN